LDCYDYFKEETDDGSIVYLFGTDSDIFYQISFDINLYSNHLDRFPFLLQHGYGLGIYPSGSAKSSPKVSNTIKAILSEFFSNQDPEAFLLYHCEHNDGKQAARNRLFDKWHNESKDEEKTYKYSLEVEINISPEATVKHYIGFISKSENSNNETAIEEFEQFSVDLLNENINKQ
jgi:Family of unknown function (DUF6169)